MSHESNNTEQLPSLPLELIERIIIPNSAVSWLRVSKKYNSLAINYAKNDPIFLKDPKSAVQGAIVNKNYALLDALFTDARYRANYILSQVFNMGKADKSTNMIFLKHFSNVHWITVRILDQAAKSDWIDVIDYIGNNDNVKSIQFDCFDTMSERIFTAVIHHPKLQYTDNLIYQIATNLRIPNKIKLKILDIPNIYMSLVIEKFACHEEFVDALLEDQRVKESINLQQQLWTRIIATQDSISTINHFYDKCEKVRMILAKKLLDPSIDFNFPLRIVFKERKFEEKSQKIAAMLLDDERVILTLEPFEKNLIYTAIVQYAEVLTAKVKFILSHHKYKKEWFESVMTYLLDQQCELKTINNTEKLFIEHQFDEYLSEEIRARAPKAIKQLHRMHSYYYNYFDETGFYSDEDEDEEKFNDDEIDESVAPLE